MVDESRLETDFSFSKLYCAVQCPQKAYLRYVLGLPDDTHYLIMGKAIHFGQQVDNQGKVEGRDLTVRQVLDAAVDSVKEEAAKHEVAVDVDDFAKDHAAQLQKFRDLGWRDEIAPVAGTIEAPFEISVRMEGGLPAKILGFVDVVSEKLGRVARDPAQPQHAGEDNEFAESSHPGGPANRRVIDYKSGARPVYQGDASTSLQFCLYQIGAKAPESQVISFVRTGRQRATVHRTEPVVLTQPRVNKLLAWLEDAITLWRTCLKTGFWPRCSPQAHYCSASACAYYSRCYPSEGRKTQVISLGEIKPVGTVPVPEWRRNERSTEKRSTDGS